MARTEASLISTARLTLEPLKVEHAHEMVEVLAGTSIYEFTGGAAPSEEDLIRRYASQSVGHSPDGSQIWLNWIVRHSASKAAVGYVQATLVVEGGARVAYVAWVIGAAHQRNGFATEASLSMIQWLKEQGTARFAAYINPRHHASEAIARRIGLHAGVVVEADGERRWDNGTPGTGDTWTRGGSAASTPAMSQTKADEPASSLQRYRSLMVDHADQPQPAATGAQYEISRGDAQVTVAELAGALRSFRRGGIELTETYPDDSIAPAGAGILLAPWPNRVANGRWVLDGAKQQLDITEVVRNNAIHGLLRNTGYQLMDRSGSKVVLAATIFPQHGYPFHAQHRATYELEADLSLTVTQELVNKSGVDIPFALGAHPYLRIGDIPSGELTITVNAGSRLLTNDQLIPTGTEPVRGSFDLRKGRKVSELDLDTCFTDLGFEEGRCGHTLSADDGRTVTLWMDEEFGYTQVFVTDQFPGRGKAVAMEPMTAPADAFNSGDGLRWLEPGGTFGASWGISANFD